MSIARLGDLPLQRPGRMPEVDLTAAMHAGERRNT
jgi:hypothetical protein